MDKKKIARKLLITAMAVSGIYLVILILLTCLQKWLKPLQNAPLGVRNTFYLPIDDLTVSAVCLVLMILFSLVLLRRVKAGAKAGSLPWVGMVGFGILVPFLSKLASYCESLRLSAAQTSTEESINYVMSASYVHDITAWITPLLFVSSAIFVAGCAIALCVKES